MAFFLLASLCLRSLIQVRHHHHLVPAHYQLSPSLSYQIQVLTLLTFQSLYLHVAPHPLQRQWDRLFFAESLLARFPLQNALLYALKPHADGYDMPIHLALREKFHLPSQLLHHKHPCVYLKMHMLNRQQRLNQQLRYCPFCIPILLRVKCKDCYSSTPYRQLQLVIDRQYE
ncbi:Uncharacterised protein [Streptococcus pneumoniae]|nr:Uncharacterised protein [Streptococcus pneumoniae]